MDMYEKLSPQRSELIDFLLGGAYDYDKLKELWHAYFSGVLEDMCWNEAAIEASFQWGHTGHNWRKLHWDHLPTEPFELEAAMRSLAGEIGYSSDRLTLDHLFRAHHDYNCIQCEEALNRFMNK